MRTNLDGAARDNGVSALLERLRDGEFQLARLVAAAGEAELVVTLDPQVDVAAERLRQARHGLERRVMRSVNASREL